MQSIVEEERRKDDGVLHIDKALKEEDKEIRFKFHPHRFACMHVSE